MTKFVSRLVMTAAVAGMACAPIAVQANTRAGDNSTTYSASAVSQPGAARSDEGESLRGTSGIIVTLLAAALVAGIIVIIDDDDDDDNQSPGAN